MAETVYKSITEIINHNTRYDINKITFYRTSADGTLVIPDTNLFRTYMRFIEPYIFTYSVPVSYRERYKRRPAMLSKDLYGTPFLMWLVLLLNDQECPSKFYVKSTIKLIPTDYLNAVFDTVVTKSHGKLDENWAEYLALTEDFS